jgi:RNA polymerase sigma factor (TIGR02999 family)
MSEFTPGPVTLLLRSIQSGDYQAAGELLPIVYAELRNLGRAMIARLPPGNTLQGTALVHEAYLRLVGDEERDWKCRAYFFAAAAQAMRRIVIEQGRRKAALKHGGGRMRLDIDEIEIPIAYPVEDMQALDESLTRLRAQDPRKADVVDLRFFAGLSIEETARVLGVSEPTVERDWRFARAYLFDELHMRGES